MPLAYPTVVCPFARSATDSCRRRELRCVLIEAPQERRFGTAQPGVRIQLAAMMQELVVHDVEAHPAGERLVPRCRDNRIELGVADRRHGGVGLAPALLSERDQGRLAAEFRGG